MTPFWFKCRFFAMSFDCDGGTNILWIYQVRDIGSPAQLSQGKAAG